jgi:hypothetical protein
LQKRFTLWDHRITLTNGTDIQYKNLTVPCCLDCNGKYLSGIEKAVEAATLKGYDAVAALDPMTLYLWLGKILYGIFYRNCSW